MSSATNRQEAIQSIASATYQLNRINFKETHIKDLFEVDPSGGILNTSFDLFLPRLGKGSHSGRRFVEGEILAPWRSRTSD